MLYSHSTHTTALVVLQSGIRNLLQMKMTKMIWIIAKNAKGFKVLLKLRPPRDHNNLLLQHMTMSPQVDLCGVVKTMTPTMKRKIFLEGGLDYLNKFCVFR